MGVFSMAWFTCLSRISDYKHHWSDVLGGATVGALSAVIVVSLDISYFIMCWFPQSEKSGKTIFFMVRELHNWSVKYEN